VAEATYGQQPNARRLVTFSLRSGRYLAAFRFGLVSFRCTVAIPSGHLQQSRFAFCIRRGTRALVGVHGETQVPRFVRKSHLSRRLLAVFAQAPPVVSRANDRSGSVAQRATSGDASALLTVSTCKTPPSLRLGSAGPLCSGLCVKETLSRATHCLMLPPDSGGTHHRYIRTKLRRALLAGMDARELSLAITR
jgi:hypothetical protein